jgi:hypothetical protein
MIRFAAVAAAFLVPLGAHAQSVSIAYPPASSAFAESEAIVAGPVASPRVLPPSDAGPGPRG